MRTMRTGNMPESPIAVDVDGVSKRFSHRVKGDVYAARNVRFAAAPGEFVTLLGPSGCGKTTTLRMIAGFEQPDEGRVRFGSDDVTHVPANRRGIGFVFQNYALFPHLSVFDNVAYGLQVRGEPARDVATRVGDVLALGPAAAFSVLVVAIVFVMIAVICQVLNLFRAQGAPRMTSMLGG
jgi:ABC-type Fe3+/spermidine/putrescine transport system ATPase subunit